MPIGGKVDEILMQDSPNGNLILKPLEAHGGVSQKILRVVSFN